MNCAECRAPGVSATRIRYVDGTTEVLQLCPTCRRAFEDGGFVSDVELLRTSTPTESTCVVDGPAGRLVERSRR